MRSIFFIDKRFGFLPCRCRCFQNFSPQLAVLSGLFRVHPNLRQRYCADWPEYQWAEICKRMRLEHVRSLDKVSARFQSSIKQKSRE